MLQIAEFGSWPSGDPKISLPKLYGYIERIESEAGYKKSIEKIKQIDANLGVDFKRF
jgi:glutathione S-transferase